MSKSYLIVFHGDYELLQRKKRIVDISDDPCFDNPPTWGICRPPTRKSISVGDKLFFIAYYKEVRKYYIKGWFEVGEKISYYDALNRFPHRQNVIISKNARKTKNLKWRYDKLENEYMKQHGKKIPKWLKSVVVSEGSFYQNSLDNHEIDNWKCRRIFHCTSKQFRKCISNDTCKKNGSSLTQYKNYIVSHPTNCGDLGNKLIEFNDFTRETGIEIKLATPKGQHNVRSVDNLLDNFLRYFETYLSK